MRAIVSDEEERSFRGDDLLVCDGNIEARFDFIEEVCDGRIFGEGEFVGYFLVGYGEREPLLLLIVGHVCTAAEWRWFLWAGYGHGLCQWQKIS